jgi:hypothetical protein
MSASIRTCSWCPHAKRSREHHNLIFHIVAAAYENWPPHEQFQPTSAEHLRAWALVEVGWKQELEVDLGDAFDLALKVGVPATVARRFVGLVSGALIGRAKSLMDKPPLRMIARERSVVLVAPKSISKSKCTGEEYTEVCDKVISELAFRIGVSVELLKQTGASRISKGKAAA